MSAALSAILLLAGCGGGTPIGGDDGGGGGGGGDGGSCVDACAAGAKACEGNGFKVCEAQADGCLGWSAVTGCEANEVCDTGACRKNCVNNCGAGTSLCEAGGTRACEQKSNGCYDWGVVVACGSAEVCSGGVCASTCTNQCTEGAKQCTPSGFVTCQKLSSGCTEWVSPTTCPAGQVCSAGSCVPNGSCTDVCNAGESRCTVSGQVQECVTLASGCRDWALPTACASGQSCVAPATTCAAISCSAGETRCNGTSIETCTAAGAWLSTTTCPQACNAGTCVATVSCSAGAVRCNANAVEVCNSSGTAWLHSQSCTVGCAGGVCTGPCAAGAKRCNGNIPETCDVGGAAWTAGAACSTACFEGSCIEADLIVDGVNVTMDGEHHFQNSVIVRNGGSLSVGPTATLKLRAKVITVDGASNISANGVSDSPYRVSSVVNMSDLSTAEGYRYNSSQKGGGLIDLRGEAITIDGQVTANAGGTYAGGGTVLLAADKLDGTGVVQAISVSSSSTYRGAVKLLHGSSATLNATSGYHNATKTIMPPMSLVSSTHPDPTRKYHSGAKTLELAWERPFPSVNGYYYLLSSSATSSVTPSNGTFLQAESVSIPFDEFTTTRYFHIISVDAAANYGTTRNVFPINLVSQPPSISSSSHPSQGSWYVNNAAYVSWSPYLEDADVTGYYYVLDKFGDTVPTEATGVFTTNKQALLSNLADGAWVFHIVSRDTQLRTTPTARHFKLFIGETPLKGNISGSVYDGSNGNAAVNGVTLSINRGLMTATTTSTGTYTFNSNVFEGTWELTASKSGYISQTKTVTVTADAVLNENFVLQRVP